MSNPRLVEFIRKLQGELSNYEEYRKELNRQPQTFVFHKTSLFTETIKQLDRGHGTKLSAKQKKRLKELVDDAADALHKQLEQIQGSKLPRPGGKTTMRFTNETDVPIPAHYNKFLPYTAFSRVKFAYRGVMNDFFNSMQAFLRDETEHDVVRTKSGLEKKSIKYFFDAGHDSKAGVFEKFLDSKTSKIMQEIDKSNEKMSAQELKKLEADLAKEGIKISLQKLDDSDSIIIKVESTNVNRSRGQKSGLRSKKLRQNVKAFLEREDLEDLEGSDSLKERKNKKVRRKTTDPFKKLRNNNVKVKTDDLKDEKSSTKPATASTTAKVKGKKSSLKTKVAIKKAKRRKPTKSRHATNDLLQMIGLINKELPKTVRKNMVAPRLENRTGRFADSVQVTEITQTRKGFPSIGYTYQRNPYEVFEEGSQGNWSNGDRDPRDLIDMSIREIAARMALGRLYTRRV
jgi:hypothetical protein